MKCNPQLIFLGSIFLGTSHGTHCGELRFWWSLGCNHHEKPEHTSPCLCLSVLCIMPFRFQTQCRSNLVYIKCGSDLALVIWPHPNPILSNPCSICIFMVLYLWASAHGISSVLHHYSTT